MQLGPQSASSWSLGSRGGAQISQQRYTDDKQMNKFAPLESGMSDNRKSQKYNIVVIFVLFYKFISYLFQFK